MDDLQPLIDFHQRQANVALVKRKSAAQWLGDNSYKSNNQVKKLQHEINRLTKQHYRYQNTVDALVELRRLKEAPTNV